MHMRAIVGPDLQRVAAGDHSEDADDRAFIYLLRWRRFFYGIE